MGPIGKAIFLTKGVGKHREKLTSFELALRDGRIAEFNLVRVSSIFPPGCKVISIQDGLKTLTPGQIVYAVMYDNSTNEPHRLVAASVVQTDTESPRPARASLILVKNSSTPPCAGQYRGHT